MQIVLALMVVALFAYLGSALFRADWLPPSVRALVSSGIGFFGVGLALGPMAFGVLDAGSLGRLDVLVNLGIGWVGLLFGLQFNFGDLRRLPTGRIVGAFVQAGITLLVCAFGMWLVSSQVSSQAPGLALSLVTLAVLGALGSSSSPTSLALVVNQRSPRGPLTDTLRLFNSMDAMPGLLVFGLVVCLAPVHPERFGWPHDMLYWVGVALGLGLALGALFHLLTLYRYDDNQLLVIVLGLVVFCGGAAYYLVLSPLLVNFIVGLVVANRSPQRQPILRVLLTVEKPIYLCLLTLAGAMWRPIEPWLWLLVGAFVLIRLVGKVAGGYVAAPLAGVKVGSALGMGPGLWDHGGMALIIGLSSTQVVSGPVADLILTATVASMAVTTGLGTWSVQRLLTRQGELT